MSVSCQCCVLSGRGLCNWSIPRPEKSHRLSRVIVCDPETSRIWQPWPALGCCATVKKNLGHNLNINLTAYGLQL
jgi:hypothetical protein